MLQIATVDQMKAIYIAMKYFINLINQQIPTYLELPLHDSFTYLSKL